MNVAVPALAPASRERRYRWRCRAVHVARCRVPIRVHALRLKPSVSRCERLRGRFP